MNKDCFAFGKNKCLALNKNICDTRTCPFYKTPEEIEQQEKQTELRIKSLYGVTPKEFIKGGRRYVEQC